MTPTYSLDVANNTQKFDTTLLACALTATDTIGDTTVGGSFDCVARFSGGIGICVNGAVVLYSDKRIKNIINEQFDDLDLIQKLDVVRYRYKDIQKGNKINIGFIAQDVKQVLPDAISYDTTYIPDVMKQVEQIDGKILTLQNHTICENDEIKLYDSENKEHIVNVTRVISPDEFEIDQDLKCDKLFLFGRKVNDLHMLDYNSIFALAFSGVKTLLRENNELKNKVSKMEELLQSMFPDYRSQDVDII